MATKGYIDQLLNALPTDLRYPLRSAFYYVMDNWRVGDGRRAENAQWYAMESTTASVANTEFSILHGMGAAPGRFIPVVRLNEVGNQLVTLTVTRAADAQRLYFSSPSTSAVFSGFLEI